MLEGSEMNLLRSIYHFMLFLIVSWTTYNTLLFLCPLLPTYENELSDPIFFHYWNLYLLGALDFHALVKESSDAFRGLLYLRGSNDLSPFSIYNFSVNGLAAYIWCSDQNSFSGGFLALAGCIAGPYMGLMLHHYMLLLWGIITIVAFYGILSDLIYYRKKRFPHWTLPAWLQWRRPNMVPSLKAIAVRIAQKFRK